MNYSYPYASLWVLFLVPAVSVVILSPKWQTVLLTGIAVNIVTVITESLVYVRGQIYFVGVERLIVAGFVGWVLFIFISYLRITNTKLVNELENLALTDPLTKIYNRRYLNLHMEKALPLAKREKSLLTIVLIDIDHFKKINDSYGHNAGDIILKKLAKLIKENLRKSDVFIRLGGEEFLIVLPSTSLNQGHQVADWIRKMVQKENLTYGRKKIPVTLSLGVAQYNHEQNLDDFIHQADEALYRAKENGRNQVVSAG